MKTAGTMIRGEEVEFFLRLHGLWEGVLDIPPPPELPYDIETMEPIREPPSEGRVFEDCEPTKFELWQSGAGAASRTTSDPTDQRTWEPDEVVLDDGRILILDSAEPLAER